MIGSHPCVGWIRLSPSDRAADSKCWAGFAGCVMQGMRELCYVWSSSQSEANLQEKRGAVCDDQ